MSPLSFAFALAPRPRGVHLITRDVLREVDLTGVDVGLLHLFLQHTSAALALGENASPEVRGDLERWFGRVAPDGAPYFRHTLEGADDMAAHAKSVMVGCSLTLPVRRGELALGTWQGLYLCEFRDRGGPRRLLATLLA